MYDIAVDWWEAHAEGVGGSEMFIKAAVALGQLETTRPPSHIASYFIQIPHHKDALSTLITLPPHKSLRLLTSSNPLHQAHCASSLWLHEPNSQPRRIEYGWCGDGMYFSVWCKSRDGVQVPRLTAMVMNTGQSIGGSTTLPGAASPDLTWCHINIWAPLGVDWVSSAEDHRITSIGDVVVDLQLTLTNQPYFERAPNRQYIGPIKPPLCLFGQLGLQF